MTADQKSIVLAFRAAAQGALAPEEAFLEGHREAAKAFRYDTHDAAGNITGRCSSYTYGVDEAQERAFHEARTLASILSAIADAYEKVDATPTLPTGEHPRHE